MSELIQSGAESENLRQQNESLRQEMTKLAEKVLVLDQMRAKELEWENQAAEMLSQQQQHQAVENEIRSLRVQLAGSVQTASQLANARMEIDQLRIREKRLNDENTALLPLKDQNEELGRKVASLEMRVSGLIESESESALLRREIATLESEREALIKETREQSLFLKQQVETLKLKNQAFAEAEENRKGLLEQVRQLQERTQILEESNAEVSTLREELHRLQTAESDLPKPGVANERLSPEIESRGIVGAPVGADPTPSTQKPSIEMALEETDSGFSRFESDSTREALEQRIRDEIERRRAFNEASSQP